MTKGQIKMADNESAENVSAKGFGNGSNGADVGSTAENMKVPHRAEEGNVSTSGNGGGFFTGLILGSALGALLAFLYAPQGGEVTRRLIKQKTDDYSDLAKSKANDLSVKAKAADLTAKANDTVASVKDSAQSLVNTTKAVADDQKSRIAEAVDAGKQAAQETKDQLTAQAEMPVEHPTETV